MNAGENSNMNMNMIMPGGKRSLPSTVVSYIAKFICLSMQKQQQQLRKTSDVSYEDILQKMMATFSGFALSKSSSGGGDDGGGSAISGHLSSRQIEHMIVGRCQSNFS
jgi:hypothetical protein